MAPDSNSESGAPPSLGAWSTMAGMRLLGAMRRNSGRELLSLADVDRHDPVRQAGLLEEDRELVSVGRGPVVEIDHGSSRAVGGGTLAGASVTSARVDAA